MQRVPIVKRRRNFGLFAVNCHGGDNFKRNPQHLQRRFYGCSRFKMHCERPVFGIAASAIAPKSAVQSHLDFQQRSYSLSKSGRMP